MNDELDRLRTNSNLLALLIHYAELGAPSREAWQDRLMAMDGEDGPGMSKLHGELIAFGWIEQNTGNAPGLRGGVVPACYRVALAGLRALQQIQAPEAEAVDERAVEERPVVKRVKRRREKSEDRELVGAAG